MKKTIYILAATMLLFGSSNLRAQCNVESDVSPYFELINTTIPIGQSFVATCSGAIDVLTLPGFSFLNGSTNAGQLTIYSGNGLGGTVIYSQPFSVVQSGDNTAILLSAGAVVTAGNSYTFYITNTSNFLIEYSEDFYPGGGFFYAGINYTASYDLLFNVHIGNACTATSSTTNLSICSSALPYSWNGLTFNTAGSQTKTLTNAAGCDSIATLNLSVISGLPAITGSSAICVGGSVALSNTQAGGVWSSLNNRATVNASGEVTGANAGSALIAYKLTTGGCNITTTTSVTVNAIPSVPSIGYAAGTVNPQRGAPSGSFCANRTFTVVGSPAGGAWSSTGVLNVTTPAGVVSTGAIAGAGTLKYTYTSAAGCSNSRTMAGNVVVCAARGVNTVDGEGIVASNDFTIYPNPAKTFISLNVETLIGKGSIVITDLYGKQVKTQSLSMGTNTIDISKLSKGMYFVSTITNEGKTTKKLLVE